MGLEVVHHRKNKAKKEHVTGGGWQQQRKVQPPVGGGGARGPRPGQQKCKNLRWELLARFQPLLEVQAC